MGTALGDLLPDERLPEATGELGKALAIVNHLDKGCSALKVDLWKKIGNEMRKQGAYADAGPLLERSLAVDPHNASRGSGALCLARLRANQQDKRGFAGALRTALVCMDRVSAFSPTFNPIAVNEVRLRGALQLGQLCSGDIERMCNEAVAGLAPHWSVIREATIAEAWMSVGNTVDAISHANRAIDGAVLCKLRCPNG